MQRGQLATEQRLPAAAAIDALSVEQTMRLMNTQDVEVPLAVRKAIPALTKLTEDLVPRLRRGGRLLYVGAGTSGRLAVLDAAECPPTFHSDPEQVQAVIAGGDAAIRKSAEGIEDQEQTAADDLAEFEVTDDDLVVGIAAGGTTPYVWAALKAANAAGAGTGFITAVPVKSLMTRPRSAVVAANEDVKMVPKPSLPCPVDHVVELLVGPEVLSGSTRLKAGTATKLALNMISTSAMLQLGKAWGNLMVDLRVTNDKLRDRAMRILTSQTGLSEDEAESLLDRAEGRVKVALVMQRLSVDLHAAKKRLEENEGRLRPLLGPPR